MSIHWGGYSGHARAGISASISPQNPDHSDTTVKVTWEYYAGTDGWGFVDTWSYSYDAESWGGGSESVEGRGFSSKLIQTHSINYNINYDNKRTVSANAHIRGLYNGGTPDVSYSIDLPKRPPTTPSAGMAPSASSVSNTDATISWGPPNDNGGSSVDQYQLQVSRGSGYGGGLVYDQSFSQTGNASRDVNGLEPNTHYYARVRAHNSAGWGDWTSATGCQFTTTGGLPSTPTGLIYLKKDQTSIRVAWNSAASNGGGAVDYDVRWGLQGAGFTGQVNAGTGEAKTISGLTPNTAYSFQVRSHNSFGYSSWSGSLIVSTKPVPIYVDEGPFTNQINNFSKAVADKLVHLGINRWQGHSGGITVPGNGVTWVPMNDLVDSGRGPDGPSHSDTEDTGTGSGVSFTINYPGEYAIEFAARLDPIPDGGWYELITTVNGVSNPTGSQNHVGQQAAFAPTPAGQAGEDADPNDSPHDAFFVTNFHRHLNVGDKLAFGIRMRGQATAQTTPSDGSSTNLAAYARVSMVGF